jgi:hypothetical protein
MERASKINLDTLFESKKTSNLITLKTYNTVLSRVHARIKTQSKQKNAQDSCWFVVPEIVFGCPRYEVRSCIAYIIEQLEENGFMVKYTHPNLLFISWSHWVPDYVRHELKLKTGIAINGFGETLEKREEKKEEKKEAPKFKPTSAYIPTGKFVYDQDILNSIEAKIS